MFFFVYKNTFQSLIKNKLNFFLIFKCKYLKFVEIFIILKKLKKNENLESKYIWQAIFILSLIAGQISNVNFRSQKRNFTEFNIEIINSSEEFFDCKVSIKFRERKAFDFLYKFFFFFKYNLLKSSFLIKFVPISQRNKLHMLQFTIYDLREFNIIQKNTELIDLTNSINVLIFFKGFYVKSFNKFILSLFKF